ncbi:MAG: type II toxin-antitoxin system PemK/MazF family toxin [Anaerolineales bacterium]|nr:type II toxin-antitoxin system PemK/MazF family toxin [Anaerolineales bacterium]
MKPGDVVLVRFPQTDLEAGKLRPTLVVALSPGRHSDALLAMITSRIYQIVPGFDELIEPTDKDFIETGLKTRSAIRLSRLASVEASLINARLGEISSERLHNIKQ